MAGNRFRYDPAPPGLTDWPDFKEPLSEVNYHRALENKVLAIPEISNQDGR
jgi:hypothetical protein